MKFLITTLLLAVATPTSASERILTTSEGQTAYLYTPTEKPDKDTTYWLAIGVHGAGADGKGASGLADWVKADVIALGPNFPQAKKDEPAQDANLKTLIAEVGKAWTLHPKVFLHGFSEGAELVQRFAMKNPELVAGVSAASAGSWSTAGFGDINVAASGIPFAISCGEYDREKSWPDAPFHRLAWMQEFAKTLTRAHFDVESRIIPNTGHKATADTMALAKTCFQRAKAVNFSRSVVLSCDFNDVNPLWGFGGEAQQTPAATTTTALATWDAHAGVIEKEGTAERTGALRFRVNSAAKAEAWSGTLRTGLLPAHCPESDLAKLTLAFDLSASSARPVRVVIESFDAQQKRTGGREGLVYPASPDDYQRQVLDLGAMKTRGEGDFHPGDSFIQICLSISSDLGWSPGAYHQLRLDNLSCAAPAFYVSPTGKDADSRGTAEKPLATVNQALRRAQPGDIILLMEGTYVRKNAVADFVRGGSPAAWITLKNHPGQRPVLTCPDWNIIKIGKGAPGRSSNEPALAYLEVRGLTVRGIAEEVEAKYNDDIGKPKATTNGNGISVDGRFQQLKPHHIRIADNEVLQCPGGGISVIHADYVQVENNHVHNNCHWMIYAGSGISLYQPFNFDPTTGGHHMLVRLNHAHHNSCTQPWVVTGKLSDGNGIIVDDTQNNQNHSPNGVYHGGLLIQGNLSHDNGGSGMHSYASDHVDLIHNTVCNNSAVMDYGQLSVTACGHVRVLNNILVAPNDKPLNRVNGAFHDVLLSHNLFWGGNGERVAGDHAILGDPLFRDASKADFHLGKDSPAKNAGGAWEIAPALDLEGNVRAPGALDLGAYQDPIGNLR